MLIDLHAHSSKISPCCAVSYKQALEQTLQHGMDGVALTNHYQKSYIPTGRMDEFIEDYIAEFYAAEQYGKEIGCKVYFGIEVTTERYPRVHMLIYGVAPDFLRQHPYVFDYTQKQLYELVKANDGILIQAHPFRNGTTVLDTDYMDGVEINCHPLYGKSFSKELLEIAQSKDLIVTCGGDYHADTYRPKCGMYIPDTVKDYKDLRTYLLSPERKRLCIQEPNTNTCGIIEIE